MQPAWVNVQITLVSTAVSFKTLDKGFQGLSSSSLDTGHLSLLSQTAATWPLFCSRPYRPYCGVYQERWCLLQRSCPPHRQESRPTEKACYPHSFGNVELKDETEGWTEPWWLAKVREYWDTSHWFLDQDLNQKRFPYGLSQRETAWKWGAAETLRFNLVNLIHVVKLFTLAIVWSVS